MVVKQIWTSIKSKEKVKEKEKAKASKEKESQTGNLVMEKEEDTEAEDVVSKEEEKGRGFGRGFGKGGGKYNQKGSHRKGVCNYCQEPGHYEAECRMEQRDMRTGHTRQVQDDQLSSAGVSQAATTAPSTSTTTTQQTRTTNNTRLNVRQIDVWHIGDEPDQFPEVKRKNWRLIILVVFLQCALQRLSIGG